MIQVFFEMPEPLVAAEGSFKTRPGRYQATVNLGCVDSIPKTIDGRNQADATTIDEETTR
jgi:hypothetical protein